MPSPRESSAEAEVARLRSEVAVLREQARTATLRTFLRRRVLPAGWVVARCDVILGEPVAGGWRKVG